MNNIGKSQKKKIVILGAGIAGLSTAYFLKIAGYEAVIYEQESYYGGLCSSFQIQGFTFDTFAHISFDTQTRQWLEEKTQCYEREPEALNYDRGRWIRHPVQNNLIDLPIEERIELIKGFINREKKGEINNYGEWLKSSYGSEFAYKYPYRYTRKYWTVEPEKMDKKWALGRMYQPNIEEVLRGAMTQNTEGVHYSKKAYYPKIGGIQSLLAPLVEGQNIMYNKKVCRIDTTQKNVEFQDGTKVIYDELISTIPLTELCKCIDNVPNEIENAVNKLDYTSGIMVSLGLKKENVSPSLWYYVYDEEIWPARIYAPEWKSPQNVPVGCSAIQAEVYYSKYKKIREPLNEVMEKVISQLLRLKLFSKEDIVIKDVRRKEYANIIFTPATYEARDKIHKFIDDREIFYAGRFGEWDYLWMGQSLLSGKRAADKII